MFINNERLKEIPVDENNILYFASGLFAFESLTRFVLLDIAAAPFFKWLQPVEKPEIKFLLLDPFIIKKDYYVELDGPLIDELGIEKPGDVLIYTTVTVPETGLKAATTNLVGPIIINWRKRKGKQIIIEKEDAAVKHPLAGSYLSKVSSGG